MKRTIYILAICALGLTSCTKYLDIKPYGEVIPKTADEFSSLLNTILEDIDYGEEEIIGNPDSAVEFETYADNFEANLTIYPAGNSLALYVGCTQGRAVSGVVPWRGLLNVNQAGFPGTISGYTALS